jgi:hypothetical protein
VPSGAPIVKAQALAVRLTASDKKTMLRNSASKLPINVKAVWNAAVKSLMPGRLLAPDIQRLHEAGAFAIPPNLIICYIAGSYIGEGSTP